MIDKRNSIIENGYVIESLEEEMKACGDCSGAIGSCHTFFPGSKGLI